MTPPNFTNRTMWTGDNVDIMRSMNAASVDLIYLDPPYNSNRNYAAPAPTTTAAASSSSTNQGDHPMSNKPEKYVYYQGESLDDVLDFAAKRTQQFRIISVFPLPQTDQWGQTMEPIYTVVLERLPGK